MNVLGIRPVAAMAACLLVATGVASANRFDEFFRPEPFEKALPARVVAAPVRKEWRRWQAYEKELQRIRQLKGVTVVDPGGPVEPPVAVNQAPPRPTSQRAGDLDCGLMLLVDEHGQVVALYVAYTRDTEWAQHCLAAVARWKFKPATEGGQPVASIWSQPMFMEWR